MAHLFTTKRRANTIFLALFLIGLGACTYFQKFFPEIFLVIGIAQMARQFARGRSYDMFITLFVFGGLYLYYFSKINWAYIMAIAFTVGGIYLLFREFCIDKERDSKESLEDDREEIEESKRK